MGNEAEVVEFTEHASKVAHALHLDMLDAIMKRCKGSESELLPIVLMAIDGLIEALDQNFSDESCAFRNAMVIALSGEEPQQLQ